jgi:hypothetical protein
MIGMKGIFKISKTTLYSPSSSLSFWVRVGVRSGVRGFIINT